MYRRVQSDGQPDPEDVELLLSHWDDMSGLEQDVWTALQSEGWGLQDI